MRSANKFAQARRLTPGSPMAGVTSPAAVHGDRPAPTQCDYFSHIHLPRHTGEILIWVRKSRSQPESVVSQIALLGPCISISTEQSDILGTACETVQMQVTVCYCIEESTVHGSAADGCCEHLKLPFERTIAMRQETACQLAVSGNFQSYWPSSPHNSSSASQNSHPHHNTSCLD